MLGISYIVLPLPITRCTIGFSQDVVRRLRTDVRRPRTYIRSHHTHVRRLRTNTTLYKDSIS